MNHSVLKYFTCIVVLIMIAACGTDPKTVDNPHAGAIPDVHLSEATELNASDREKLTQAKGKKAMSLSTTEFKTVLDKLDGTSVCLIGTPLKDTKRYLEQLFELSNRVQAEELNFIIYLDQKSEKDIQKVEFLVREVGLDASLFRCSDDLEKLALNGINENTEQYPCFYLYNADTGLFKWLNINEGITAFDQILN